MGVQRLLRSFFPTKGAAGGWAGQLSHPLVMCGLVLMAGLSTGIYLGASSSLHGFGFPLDDAWIHQTYARNLNEYGQWAFLPGTPSAGSTSPLWTVLLASGYGLRLPPAAWTFLLGSLCLFGLALTGEGLLRLYRPNRASHLPWAGLFLAGEWRLVWAAVSGMETLLMGVIVLLVLWASGQVRGPRWKWVGLLIGVGVWVRPDGITLLGPAAFVLLLGEQSWRSRFSSAWWLVVGLLTALIPYLVFNYVVQGSLLPNTFYAKQAEYALERQVSLLVRLFNELKLPLLGGSLFLVPGAVWMVWQSLRAKRWVVLAGFLWFLGYALLYAVRLPVTYQYGRYFMPAMPVYFVIGLAGTIELANYFRGGRAAWLLTRVWLLSAAGVWLGFFVIGAGRYAQDVAIIDTEMVAAARWVSENTAPDALIAAHDIGALGYFANRPLVDLAGLISPEVIPFIRDEERLTGWLDERGVDYLVVFEDWYQVLPEGKELAFTTDGAFSRLSGGSRMQVYRWQP